MKRIRIVLQLVMALFLTTHSFAQTAKVDALFSAIKPDTPGAAVLVLKDGHAVYQRGFGVTDLRTHHKIDEHTNFRLASLTKQFTAMAIMLLVHDGKLRYDQALTEIFPEFPAYGKSITLREILNHTSGLLDYEDLMAKQYGNTPDDQIPQIHDAGVLALMEKASTTKFPPGSKWEYSNSGYCVLAMIVEKASGKGFAEFLQERIFAPLKMAHTIAYENGRSEVANRAYGHTPQGNDLPRNRSEFDLGYVGRWRRLHIVDRLGPLGRCPAASHAAQRSGNAACACARAPERRSRGRERTSRQVRLRMVSRSLPRPPAHVALRRDHRLPHFDPALPERSPDRDCSLQPSRSQRNRSGAEDGGLVFKVRERQAAPSQRYLSR